MNKSHPVESGGGGTINHILGWREGEVVWLWGRGGKLVLGVRE